MLVSVALGIAVGNFLQISDFALTPPIDALKAIAGWAFQLTVPNAISLGIPIGLFARTAFSPTVALATVVGPLIEVPVMLFLVWSAMRLAPRLFGVHALPVVPAAAASR